MDRNKLDKIAKEIEAARHSPQTELALVDLAKRCGREMRTGGKHPMWVSPAFPHHRPFPISCHGGNPTVHPHVRKVILGHLEADIAAWQEVLDRAEEGRPGNENGGKNAPG
jgi:hypothetical protein